MFEFYTCNWVLAFKEKIDFHFLRENDVTVSMSLQLLHFFDLRLYENLIKKMEEVSYTIIPPYK